MIGWEHSWDLLHYLTLCWALRFFFCVGSRFSVSASECFGGFGASAGLWVVGWVSGPLVAFWAVWRLWGLGWALGSRLGFGAIGWALGLRLGFGQSAGPWVHWPGFGAFAELWVVGWVLGDLRP